jgi:hypothetical protein
MYVLVSLCCNDDAPHLSVALALALVSVVNLVSILTAQGPAALVQAQPGSALYLASVSVHLCVLCIRLRRCLWTSRYFPAGSTPVNPVLVGERQTANPT